MRIALISPKSSFLGRNQAFQNFLNNSAEMDFYKRYWSGLGSGLLIIAALTPDKFKTNLIDENIEQINFDEHYDLVAISAMTQQADRAYEIAKIFRRKNVKVVIGGIHSSVLPDEAAGYVDSVVVGEVENIWDSLLNDLQSNKLKRIYNSKHAFDLKKSVIPKYELLKEKPYNVIWVQATRGCPHDCSFCCASKIFGYKYRRKPVAKIIAEIEKLRSVNKYAIIGFADDNMLCNSLYSKQLLEKLSNLNINWVGQTDISIAKDKKLLRLISESGCIALFIGFESISESNLSGLDSINWKQKQRQRYEQAIDIIQSHGIGIIGTFIVGFDKDDESVFEKTAQFIIDNKLSGAQISALTPFPKTRVRQQLLREHRVLNTPWSNYTFYDVNIKPKKMTPKKLEQGILNTFKAIYNQEVGIRKAKHFKSIFSSLRKEKEKAIS